MALDSGAVTLPGRGYVFIHDTPGTADPADTVAEINALDLTAATLATGWRNLGHTSRENAVTLGRDGGDVTALGSWQADSLYSSTDPVTYSITLNPLQSTNDVFKAYFGGGDITDPDVFVLPDSPGTIEKAFYMVLESGSTRMAWSFPKVSLSAGDSVEIDPEALLEFPLTATILKGTSMDLGRIYRTGLGTPA
jgi:hypothetical protein